MSARSDHPMAAEEVEWAAEHFDGPERDDHEHAIRLDAADSALTYEQMQARLREAWGRFE